MTAPKARAPRPGANRRTEQTAADQVILTLTIKREIQVGQGRTLPESHTLAVNNLPMRERLICRKATGIPFGEFWGEGKIDLDSVVVLWWLARRMNGEAALTFDLAAEQWPDDLDIETELELETNEPDEEADDPEA